MPDNKQKTKKRARWYHWVIAGAILATVIAVSFTVVPQMIIPSQDGNLMSSEESSEALQLYWKNLPHFETGNAWSLSPDIQKVIDPNTNIEYTGGFYSVNVLNAPLWKENGLMPGVALVIKNSNYTMSGIKNDGTVLFCYNWYYDANGVKQPLAGTIVVLCNLVNFNLNSATVDYTVKYI